jgi:UDP-N-acetylglucosamine transferase subunit ALG13
MGRFKKILSKSFIQGDYLLIFVTVGTQKFQFDRLFREIDLLIEQGFIQEEVFAQIGYTDYKPKHFKHSKLVEEEEMNHAIEKSSLVITHSGTSSIIKCLKMGKKVIVVPRLAKFHEHVDDHQLEIAEVFDKKNAVEVVYDIKKLKDQMTLCRNKEYSQISFDNTQLLQSIKDFVNQL